MVCNFIVTNMIGFYEIDAQTFASWGIDFLKLDFCNLDSKIEAEPWVYYEQMSKALNQTGMFYNVV